MTEQEMAMIHEHHKASPAFLKLPIAKSLGMAALLLGVASPALAQQQIDDVLRDQGYHQTFNYNFGKNTKPEDIDGSTIWDRNLWNQGWIDPHQLVKQDDYYTLLTRQMPKKALTMTSFTTWSKEQKKPLFKFQYGYFEATMRFKASPINVPAFWALSTTLPLMPTVANGLGQGKWCEIDVYEGSNPGHLLSDVHDWTAGQSVEMPRERQQVNLPADTDFTHWNRFGALWTKETIKFYFNGVQVNETPTPKICQGGDMFLVISSQSRDASAAPLQLDVKNVRVLQN